MAWIEGLSSSNRILRDLANIVTQANKDTGGATDAAKNWSIVYPRPFDLVNIIGEAMTVDGVNDKLYHSVNINWFQDIAPKVYETVAATTTVVPSTDYTVNYTAGTITFLAARTGAITVDYSYKTNESLQTALDKITAFGRVVLKTTTTPVEATQSTDPFGTDPDLAVEELTMYMEIEKPKYLINPETGQVAAKYGKTDAIINHYHINVRVFDKYDYAKEIMLEEARHQVTGEVVTEGAKNSVWSKFSWYKDFSERLVDELDTDPGTLNVGDGIVFTFLETEGMYGDIPIQYWMSTNNDRLMMVLMGDPTLNYDNYIASFLYAGKIDSFEGSVNDTAGNFALTTGSSTIPALVNPNPNPIATAPTFTVNAIEREIYSDYAQRYKDGTYPTAPNRRFTHKMSFKIIAVNDEGISVPNAPIQATYEEIYTYPYETGPMATKYDNFEMNISYVPENAKLVRIYRKDEAIGVFDPITEPEKAVDINWFLMMELTPEEATAGPITVISAQDSTKICPVSNGGDSPSVVRDPITGAIMQVKKPTSWGKDTATGVDDIAMYKTRSGVYFQRHQVSFITPDAFMKKDSFNPSRWTSKFHLSPLYIVHGYDGYRGWLKDVVVVDDSSIVHLDELIVNKGTAQEEIYKYFKLSAPFSMMQNSANSNYGIGIKKV